MVPIPLDYGCTGDRIPMSVHGVTISNQDFISISETKLIMGWPTYRLRRTLSSVSSSSSGAVIWMSSMSKNHSWNLFHKGPNSWDSTTWFRIWQFQTLAERRFFECITLLIGLFFVFFFFFFFFCGVMIGVFLKRPTPGPFLPISDWIKSNHLRERGSQDRSMMTPKWPLNSAHFIPVFTSIV